MQSLNMTSSEVEHEIPGYLGAFDYVIFGGMLAVSAAIGIYFRFSGGKQKTSEEYLMAGKNMSILPVSFSLMASFLSAITVIGTPADVYRYGIGLAFMNLGYMAGQLLSLFMCLPVYFRLQGTTAYEYLEKRYGRLARTLASMSFVGQMILYMAVVLYAPALVLSTATGLSTWTSVITIGAVCTFYCTIGGMKAVLWTDVFQALLMYGGLFAVLGKGIVDMGLPHIFKVASEMGRLDTPGFSMDMTERYTQWGLLFQSFILSLSSFCSNQVQIQRLLTVKNITRARTALYVAIPMGVAFHLLNCLAGVIIFSHFAYCDPISSPLHPIDDVDQLLPYYVMTTLGKFPGLPGLCVCGVFAASLSTISSCVNSLAAVTMQDLVRPLLATRGLSQRKMTFIAQIISLCYGALCVALTFPVAHIGSLLETSLTLYSVFSGPVLAVFLLGMLTRRANEPGVVVGLITSIAFTSWISFGSVAQPHGLPVSVSGCPAVNGSDDTFTTPFLSMFMQNVTDPGMDVVHPTSDDAFILYKLSYMWYTPIGFTIAFVFGYLASLITKFLTGKHQNVSEDLLSPFLTRFHRKGDEMEKPNVTNNISVIFGSEKDNKCLDCSKDSNIVETARL